MSKMSKKEKALRKPYLTEESLEVFLKERFPDFEVIHDRIVPGSKCKFRPDYRIEEIKLIVEFDGPRHYTQAKIILDDTGKDVIYEDLGYQVIRIPYFVQLTKPIIKKLFEGLLKDYSTFKNYPHGFISKTAILPCDFCEIGLKRFKKDITTTFEFIQDEILDSLEKRPKKDNFYMYAWPPSLFQSRYPEDPDSKCNCEKCKFERCELEDI
jgi:very-short-patch-repair endonuclease